MSSILNFTLQLQSVPARNVTDSRNITKWLFDLAGISAA